MTREQLDAIRARVAKMYYDSGEFDFIDVTNLFAEVERLRDAHAMAVQVSGELCELCGWAMKFPGEKCRCELLAEVERLTAERDTAFARGVAAMREAVVKSVTCHFPTINAGGNCGLCTFCDAALDKRIRALPDPEDK